MPYSVYPKKEEYPEYFEQYIAKTMDSKDILAQLKKQQTVVLDLITSLDEKQLIHAYESGKWTVKEVLSHIIDTERIFSFRALSFARGESNSLPGYDHNTYVTNSFADSKSKMQLMEEYETNRRSTIALFRGFDNEAVNRMGHANGLELSVRAILYIIAGHELHHLSVISDKYLNL